MLCRSKARWGWCGPYPACLLLNPDTALKGAVVLPPAFPTSPSWSHGMPQLQGEQQATRLAAGLRRGVPTHLQHVGRAICPDLFTQCLMLLMSVWRCVNNPIKLFIQLCQIQSLEEGLCVLLCNSCTALQHAKVMSLWLTPSPSSSSTGSHAILGSEVLTSKVVWTPPALADHFLPVKRMEAKADKRVRSCVKLGRRCSGAGCGLLMWEMATWDLGKWAAKGRD